jgi:hypothetical protein
VDGGCQRGVAEGGERPARQAVYRGVRHRNRVVQDPDVRSWL